MIKEEKDNLKPGVGTAVIVRKDGKVLFSKRLKNPGYNKWHFPGGGLEWFEEIEDCAIRETKEETNVDIKNVRIVKVTNAIYREDNDHYVTVWVVADYAGGEVKDMEPNKAVGWDWYEWDKLPEPYFLPVKQLLDTGYNPFYNESK